MVACWHIVLKVRKFYKCCVKIQHWYKEEHWLIGFNINSLLTKFFNWVGVLNNVSGWHILLLFTISCKNSRPITHVNIFTSENLSYIWDIDDALFFTTWNQTIIMSPLTTPIPTWRYESRLTSLFVVYHPVISICPILSDWLSRIFF